MEEGGSEIGDWRSERGRGSHRWTRIDADRDRMEEGGSEIGDWREKGEESRSRRGERRGEGRT